MNDVFIWNEWTENVFCPTGKGGGVDPTCSPGGRKAAVERLKKGVQAGRAGEYDPLGQEAAGPPGGMEKGAPMIVEAVQKYHSERSIGKPLDKLYEDVKGETGWTKEEFNRALVALHGDKIRLSGWAKTIDEIPDPEIAPMVSEMIMGYANPR